MAQLRPGRMLAVPTAACHPDTAKARFAGKKGNDSGGPLEKRAYSCRSVTMGSTLVARRAGMYVASMVTAIKNADTKMSVKGS